MKSRTTRQKPLLEDSWLENWANTSVGGFLVHWPNTFVGEYLVGELGREFC